ncbi:hypothetical protein V500_07577 [Pseudogymnoascus sp. VKM F-4518 (FW-2643)]|nr:hypothetical protein V500_07577 [Pseudogymnoascus sp. VKM F-4518 (FW-2643)]
MCTPMSYDDVAWEKSDDVFDAWKHKLYRNDVLQAIGRFIQKHRGGVAIKLCNPLRGSFNVCIKVEFLDGGSAVIRIPCPGVVMFPEEKVKREVATMRYVQENTSIPVSLILHYRMADECPYNLRPFIIMEYVKHAYDLTELFKEQDSTGDTMAIDPNITDEKLSCVYEQMADILLELSKCSFPEVGSLVETREFEYSVSERAMTSTRAGGFRRGKDHQGGLSLARNAEELGEWRLVHYAARKSWAVDAIYWSKIDERFFGTRDSFEGRLALLDEGDREGVDAFVQRKIEEQESRVLIDWDVDGVDSTGNEVTSAKVQALAD